MLQYILNTTAIWLLSLIVFDLFLRRDTFHNYNRAYLLFTFLLGILLPLWKWKANNVSRVPATFNAPLQQLATIHQSIASKVDAITTNSVHHAAFNWLLLIDGIYIIGVAVAFVLFINEIAKLLRLFKGARRTQYGKWLIIETGQSHAPCSLLHFIFVSNRGKYTQIEWDTIIEHEQRHGSLLHLADLLLMQLAKIILWFHPLVYLYENRLLLVHEYQADKAISLHPQSYGQFLLQQSLLQSGITISHSLTRSPIKKRIVMLTKHSSAFRSLKFIIVIPVLLCSLLCFTQYGFSNTGKIAGNKIFYNGNVFETKSVDTETVYNGNTNKVEQEILKHAPYIITMNGKPVYKDYSGQGPEMGSDIMKKNLRKFYRYLIDNSSSLLAQLDNGVYEIDLTNTIIDEKGRLVYYEDHSNDSTLINMVFDKDHKLVSYDKVPEGLLVKPVGANFDRNVSKDINEPLKEAIDKRLHELLNSMPLLYPVHLDGKAVPFELDGIGNIEIKDHHIVAPGFLNKSF